MQLVVEIRGGEIGEGAQAPCYCCSLWCYSYAHELLQQQLRQVSVLQAVDRKAATGFGVALLNSST